MKEGKQLLKPAFAVCACNLGADASLYLPETKHAGCI